MQSERAEYVAALDQERNRVREFLHLLETEQAALVDGDHDRLLAFTAQKATHILELRRYADNRTRLLTSYGLRPDKDGMSAWIEQHADQSTRRIWDEIKTLAAKVHATNAINGVLVEARLKNNQASIAALQTAARNTGVYGPDGGPRLTHPSGRELASA